MAVEFNKKFDILFIGLGNFWELNQKNELN